MTDSRQWEQRGGGQSLEATGPSGTYGLLFARLLALMLLFGASGLLYYVAASDGFKIERVVVLGSQLVPPDEIESAAAVTGLNIFWLKEEEVGHRLQAITAIQSVRARAVLPDRLEVRIVERAPVAVWQNGGMSYLVDAEGRILRATDRAVALPTIQDLSSDQIPPSGAIDRAALSTLFQLQQLLPGIAGINPGAVEYSADTGVTIIVDGGQRVRFGRDDDLEWKVNAVVALRRELGRVGQRAELIDVRFRDRPYVR
ncbi:MAG: cell division protein FtsQ/DivIB [Chloroflexi bacterium]|nr:cell division protein FtsQ/DivIB [Chloroflexota bacterium]